MIVEKSGADMSGGILRMAIATFMEGRVRSARGYVQHQFETMDDKTLASLGVSREAIVKGKF